MQYIQKTKIVSLDFLRSEAKELKNTGSKVVLTNGCFDILHKGHIKYLRECRCLGDVLVVGLNSDPSVKRLKGDDRPINNEEDRAYLLEALDFVDYIVVFEEDTPMNIIESLHPDIYAKGGDYDYSNLIGPGLGGDIVESYGGKIVLLSLVDGYSTSNILKNKNG